MVKKNTSVSSPQLTRIYAWFSAMADDDFALMDELHIHGLPVDVPHPLRHTTALMEATRLGRSATVSWLLARGAAPAFLCGLPRGTPLHCATRHCNWKICRELIENTKNCSITDAYGRTPLHIMGMEGGVHGRCEDNEEALEIASLLIARGCLMDAVDHEGITALHYCTINDYLPMAELLLQQGANANALTPDTHVSPLMIAVLEKNLPLAALLIEHGANPHERTREGSSPASTLPAIAMLAEAADTSAEQYQKHSHHHYVVQ